MVSLCIGHVEMLSFKCTPKLLRSVGFPKLAEYFIYLLRPLCQASGYFIRTHLLAKGAKTCQRFWVFVAGRFFGKAIEVWDFLFHIAKKNDYPVAPEASSASTKRRSRSGPPMKSEKLDSRGLLSLGVTSARRVPDSALKLGLMTVTPK